ncbi:hypothetical protein [Sinorhizobium medicae]|uniref:hypothetical protein n=1 Tax=Sinorhizobium medicae TaxID=110321 RepID=UPI000462C559|nr:hypothetical protein [Sinorhizobium medicae]RVQ59535.1 hypothetical protein CN244_28875 [Sinorhizobium medicae]
MYGLSALPNGRIDATIEWKSDVRPNASATRGYARQITDYIEVNEIERGYIVYMTTGQVVEVPNRKLLAGRIRTSIEWRGFDHWLDLRKEPPTRAFLLTARGTRTPSEDF